PSSVTRTWRPSCSRRSGRATSTVRVATPASSSSGRATATTRRWRASNWSDPGLALVRVRLTVAYDGTDYHGFAPNAGVVTVGGVLAARLEKVLGAPVELTCAGRTDAGVHAWGQVVSFETPLDLTADGGRLDLDDLVRAVNRGDDDSLVVRDAAV